MIMHEFATPLAVLRIRRATGNQHQIPGQRHESRLQGGRFIHGHMPLCAAASVTSVTPMDGQRILDLIHHLRTSPAVIRDKQELSLVDLFILGRVEVDGKNACRFAAAVQKSRIIDLVEYALALHRRLQGKVAHDPGSAWHKVPASIDG